MQCLFGSPNSFFRGINSDSNVHQRTHFAGWLFIPLPVVEWVTCSPGMLLTRVQSLFGGYLVTRMITVMAVLCHWIPSGTLRNLGDVDKRSSPSKFKLIGQKHDCPSMTLSGLMWTLNKPNNNLTITMYHHTGKLFLQNILCSEILLTGCNDLSIYALQHCGHSIVPVLKGYPNYIWPTVHKYSWLL